MINNNKDYISYEEIYEILKLSFSDIYSDVEKARKVSEIITYDDLMKICDDITAAGINLTEAPYVELSMIKNIYKLYNIKGLFDQCNREVSDSLSLKLIKNDDC